MKPIILKPATIYALARVLHWLLLGLVFAAAAWFILPAFILTAVGFSGIGFYRFLSWRMVRYELNEETLRVSTGIVFRRTDSLELFRVKDYVLTEPLLLRVFGLMNLELLTTDLTGPVTVLHAIPRSDIAELIRERVQLARQHNKIVELN